jgi:hypothetical protein
VVRVQAPTGHVIYKRGRQAGRGRARLVEWNDVDEGEADRHERRSQ